MVIVRLIKDYLLGTARKVPRAGREKSIARADLRLDFAGGMTFLRQRNDIARREANKGRHQANRRRPVLGLFDRAGGRATQTCSDILIDLDKDIELLRRRESHGFEDPAIDESAEQKHIFFNAGRQGVVRLGYFHLEDAPESLIVSEGIVKTCVAIRGVPILLTINKFERTLRQYTGFRLATRHRLFEYILVGFQSIVLHGQGPPVQILSNDVPS